jgi:hypothetical protein
MNNYNKFSIEQLPQAYFSDNVNANENRKQLVKNFIKEPECNVQLISELFFSNENIELINKQLVLAVWKRSKNTYKIPFQKKEDLITVMRYVYIQEAKNLPFKIKEQIKQLNCSVVNEIIPYVFTAVEQYEGYLRDISTPLRPPDLPINTRELDRTLPSISNIFHKYN